MDKEKLKKIIEDHQHFLNADMNGWEDMRADLIGEDLHCVNLKGVNLSWAYLENANLNGANLQEANLTGAKLNYVKLRHAKLNNANLYGTEFCHADLYGADLSGAYLEETDFNYSNLDTTDLDKKEKFRKGVILSKSIIGWKKCMNGIIVKLEIPKGAIVFCINGKKYRTNKAKVLSISRNRIARSVYNPSFIYQVGKEIEIKDFNLMYNVECGNGIHFFKYKKDAKNY